MIEPSHAFADWWKPSGFNQTTGAQTGGHRDARRKCVRPYTKEARYYGIDVVTAFNTACYREEFHQWLRDGQPPRTDDYDGTAANATQVRACLTEIRQILKGSPLATTNPF